MKLFWSVFFWENIFERCLESLRKLWLKILKTRLAFFFFFYFQNIVCFIKVARVVYIDNWIEISQKILLKVHLTRLFTFNEIRICPWVGICIRIYIDIKFGEWSFKFSIFQEAIYRYIVRLYLHDLWHHQSSSVLEFIKMWVGIFYYINISFYFKFIQWLSSVGLCSEKKKNWYRGNFAHAKLQLSIINRLLLGELFLASI